MKIGNLDKLVNENADQADFATADIADADKRMKAWEAVFGTLTSMEIQIAVSNAMANANQIMTPGGRPVMVPRRN